MKYAIRRSFFAAAITAAVALCAEQAAAQSPTNTWTAIASGNWSAGTNWDTSPNAPTSAATTILQFNSSGSTAFTATNDLGSPFLLNGVIFNSSSSGTTTITEAVGPPIGALSFVANGAVNPFLFQNNSGAITISGASTTTGSVTFAANTTLGGGGAGGVTISAPIILQGGIALNGYNTTTLSNNTAGGDIALPTTGLTITGNGIGNATFSGVLTGSSTPLTINTGANNFASGAVTLSGANTFTGNVAIQSGTLVVSNAAGLGAAANTLTISGGFLRVSATVPNNIVMSGADLIYPGTSTGTLTGTISVPSGTSGLQILGTGGLTIDNTAGFNGATTVGVPGFSSGTLTIGSSATTTGSLLNTTGITVSTASNSTSSGSLVLTNATADATRLSSSTPITLNSGRVSYVSSATLSNSVSLGDVTVNGFGGIGTQNATTDTSPTALTINSLTLNKNATVGVRGFIGSGTGYNGAVTFTNGVNGASFTPLAPSGSPTPAILPWAAGDYVASGNVTGINSLVTTSGTNSVRVLNPASGSDFALVPSGGSFVVGANNYYGTTNAASPAPIPANTTLQVNSLLFNDGTVSQDVISGGQGSVLQVYAGAIMTQQAAYFTNPQIDFGSNTGYVYLSARTFMNSAITGSGGLVVSGYAGSPVSAGLMLGAQNSFTGGLTINGAALVQFASDAALGAPGAPITFGGGSLQFFSGGAITFNRPVILTPAGGTIMPTGANIGIPDLISLNSGLVSGTGPLILNGTGTLALSGTANGAWSMVVTGGILQFTGDSNFASGPITLNGGTLQPTTSSTFSRTLQVNASSTIDVGSQTATFAGAISALGYTSAAGTPPTLTKAGVGTLTLTANNPFVGPVTVSAGTLTLSGAGQLATATTATVNAGATFTLDNTAVNNNFRYAGPVTLAGGSLNLLGNSAGSTATLGTLGSNAAGSVVTLAPASGATAQIVAAGLNLSAAGTLVVRGPGLGIAGPNTTDLFLKSAPVQVNGIVQGLVGDNSVTGGGSYLVTYSPANGIVPATLTPAGGTISTSTANVLASGATTVGATPTINSLTLASGASLSSSAANTLTLNTGMLVSRSGAASSIDVNTTIASPTGLGLTFVTAGNLTVNGPLASASGALVKLGAGTLTLASSPTITGVITAGAGTVEVPSSTTTTVGGVSGNGVVSVDGILSLTGSGTLFGSLSGAGNVIRPATASGTQTFSGPVTLTGRLEVDAGTIALASNVPTAATPIIVGGNSSTSSATLSAAPGVTISRDVDFQAGGNRSLGNTASVANQAPVILGGTVTIEAGATLGISQNNSVYTVTGQIAGPGTIFIGGGSSGAGGTLNLPTANSNFSGTVKLESQLGTVSYNTVLGIGSSGSLGTGSLVIVGGGGTSLVGGGYLQALNGPQTLSNSITVASSGVGGATLGLVGTNPLTLASVDVTISAIVIDNHSSNGSVLTINALSGSSSGSTVADANVYIGFPTTQVINNLFPVATATNVVSVGTLSNGGNTYVNGGILQITGTATVQDASGNIAGPITVAKYGTLAGTGVINRTTEIAGTIAPGIGGPSGTLTFNNPLTFDAGGKFAFAYSAITGLNAGTNYNTISSSSTLTIGDGTGTAFTNPFTINIAPGVNGSNGGPVTYTLGDFTGGILGFNAADFTVTGTFSGTPVVSVDGTGDLLQLTFTPSVITSQMWTGAVSGLWSNANNWSPTIAPSSSPNTQLTFGATANAAMTNDITGTLTLNSLTFNSGSPTYNLSGNGLNFVTSGSGALPQIVTNSANGVTIGVALTLTNNLMVSGTGNLTLNGAIGGAGSLTMAGSGTLTLGNAADNYTGGTAVLSGTVSVAADSALGTGNVTGTSLGTVNFTGTTTTTKSFAMGGGTVSVATAQTLTFNGSLVSNAFLDGMGAFATNAANGALFDNVTATASVAVVSTSPADRFVHFINSAALSVAAGVNTAGSSTTVNFNGFTNEGVGSVTIGAGSRVNVSNFQSFGTLTVNPATVGGTQSTLMTNLGTSAMSFDSGSRTFIGTPATATSGGSPTFVAGIDLEGKNLVIAGGLFVNNGYVSDFNGGTKGSIIVDYGSLYKGAGFTGVSIVTQNGGRVQAGNSPEAALNASLTIGPGQFNAFNWEINNATGVGGPQPDTNNHVSGWSQEQAIIVSQGPGQPPTSGNLTWTASSTAGNQFQLAFYTLQNPSSVGQENFGQMANFNPMLAYDWPLFTYQGAYSGPTDSATLTADTLFDTSQFMNSMMSGSTLTLALEQNPGGGGSIDILYTPVPEPGTLALVGLGGLALSWTVRRRRANAAAAAKAVA